jgi:C1A family cysteine protease
MKKINYRRCTVAKRHLRVALGAVSILTPLLLITSVKAQQPLIRPDLQIRNLPKLQLQLQPELVSKLQASKLRVSAVELDKSFLVKNNRTFIKLANGEEKQLLPLSFMEKAPSVSTSNLPEEVSDAAPYIKSARISDVARTSIFKINPKLTIPLGVDNRSKMTPVKDQGPRGTCVAFASNAALEIWSSIPDDLSEQYSNDLFMRKENRPACEDGIVTTDAASYLIDGTVTEDKWGYTMSDPACNTTVPNAAATATKYKIAESQLISDGGPTGAASIKNPRYLEALLRSGQNIVLGTHVAWGAPNSKGVLDVVIDPATNSPAASRGGHAMLICGYNAVGDYFIVKNSWGTGFGHSGYAYLSYDYIRTYAKYGYYIRKVSPALTIFTPKITPGILKDVPQIRIPR